jgi:hypothetical protein
MFYFAVSVCLFLIICFQTKKAAAPMEARRGGGYASGDQAMTLSRCTVDYTALRGASQQFFHL